MGDRLSRYDGELKASEEARLDITELLAAIGEKDSEERTQAIARYLSGASGWDEARRQLGGAFAVEPAATRLRGGEGE